jgi:hypothetical protein
MTTTQLDALAAEFCERTDISPAPFDLLAAEDSACRTDLVAWLRESKCWSFKDIGDALGVSKQRAALFYRQCRRERRPSKIELVPTFDIEAALAKFSAALKWGDADAAEKLALLKQPLDPNTQATTRIRAACAAWLIDLGVDTESVRMAMGWNRSSTLRAAVRNFKKNGAKWVIASNAYNAASHGA